MDCPASSSYIYWRTKRSIANPLRKKRGYSFWLNHVYTTMDANQPPYGMVTQPPALPPQPSLEMMRTRDNLRLLAIFHYVLGGLTCLFGLFPLIHFLVGSAIFAGSFAMPAAGSISASTPPSHSAPSSPGGSGSGATTSAAYSGAAAAPGFIMGAFGLFFMIVAGAVILVFELLGIYTILSGRGLWNQTNYTLSMVVGGISCMNMPLGTILGVFTLVVLSSREAKLLYGR